MKKKFSRRRVRRFFTHFTVAVLAAVVTYLLCWKPEIQEVPSTDKLEELQMLIDKYFVAEADHQTLKDGAAAGMVSATGDQWSYYIPASEYDAYTEQMENTYVGIGITISSEVKEEGYEILLVEPDSGAEEAGIVPGDILLEVAGRNVAQMGMAAARDRIRGEENTSVGLTILHQGQKQTVHVTRKKIEVAVAEAQMLEGNVGLVTINNFDERCADETIAAIESLVEQGAKALIFDVRFNPGGYKHELVKVLDYLLPEGPLFRSVTYDGKETVDTSDAHCLELPMAVLVNSSSYSAAEFFAAALDEYDYAVTVGQHTVGKSYFQNTFQLSDGSAVALSVGKYCTPNGVSLAEVGGLKPEVEVEVDDETAGKIYTGQLEPADDPQIQAALEALNQ